MVGLDLVASALALLAAVALGTVAHELCHAAVLRAAGVPFEFRVGSQAGDLDASFGALASVRLRGLPARPAPLRIASLAPLVLALPFLLVPAGVVPDPFAGDALVPQAALVGWLACALPSPADFGIAFHAAGLLEDEDLPEAGNRART